jgi:hypothetical protein
LLLLYMRMSVCVCTWMDAVLWLLLGRKGGRCPRVCALRVA